MTTPRALLPSYVRFHFSLFRHCVARITQKIFGIRAHWKGETFPLLLQYSLYVPKAWIPPPVLPCYHVKVQGVMPTYYVLWMESTIHHTPAFVALSSNA